jgi:prepilin-type N-terminal cleavage/methylation domain-containing protein
MEGEEMRIWRWVPRFLRGFTLIELLVVIAIIAILAAILFPVFAQARDKARQATCLSNLKQVGLGLAMYNQDYDEKMPSVCSWGKAWNHGSAATLCPPLEKAKVPAYFQDFLVPYVKNEGIWYCPSVGKTHAISVSNTAVKTFGDNGTSYIWNHETQAVPFGPLKGRPSIRVSGLAVAGIPRPAEAPVVWDMPYWNQIAKTGCTTGDPRYVSAHAKGVNVVYGDTHAKFSHFNDAASGCLEDWWNDHSWEGYNE